MNEKQYTPELQRFDELLSAYCDERLTDVEFVELENTLRQNAALRRRFHDGMNVHGQLAWSYGSGTVRAAGNLGLPFSADVTPSQSLAGTPARNAHRRWLVWSVGILATAASLFVAAWLSWPGQNQPLPGTGSSSPIVAKVVDLVGDAELVADNQTSTKPVTVVASGQEIHLGETFRTSSDDGSAVIEYADGTRVELNPDTEIQFVSYQPEGAIKPDGSGGLGKKILLNKGIVRAEVAKQPAGRPMLLVTPHAQMRVLGTSFTFGVSEESSRVDLEEGRVQFTRQSDGQTVDVEQGYYAVASATAEPLVAQQRPKATPIANTRIKPGGGHSAVLSADGSLLATLRRNQVQLWDSRSGNKRGSFDQKHTKGTHLAFSPDKQWLAIFGGDNKIVVWSVADRSVRKTFTLANMPSAVAFAADSSWLCASERAASEKGTESGGLVHRWDIKDNKPVADLRTSAKGISSLAVSPDGQLVAVGTTEGRTLIWSLGNDSQIGSFPVGTGYVTGLAFSPDGKWLAASRKAGAVVVLYNLLERGETISNLGLSLIGHGQAVRAMSFSANGQALAVGTNDGNVTLWNPNNKRELGWFGAGGRAVLSLAFVPDGNSLLTAANTGVIEFWRTPTEK